jgi:hypothetical protein
VSWTADLLVPTARAPMCERRPFRFASRL